MNILDPSLRKVATALYCHLNTPKSLSCLIALRYQEYGALVAMKADPTHYLDCSFGAEKFRKDYQAVEFLRKSPLLPLPGVNKRRVAEESFIECEKQCFITNQQLKLLRFPDADCDRFTTPFDRRLRETLFRAQRIASRILGPLPSDLNGSFGPGTSFELKGQAYSTLADKLWVQPHVTKDAKEVFEHLFWRTHWGRTRLSLGLPLPSLVEGNRFTTVPKDATKDRGICIEPLGNLWAQLGVGRYMKGRLSNVGLRVGSTSLPDCPIQRLRTRPSLDGQEIHQMLAREGSTDGSWATIDLSNASDTVSLELVRWVIPPDWFELLYALRSPKTLFKGSWWLLDKFSSMGNGFTFELETLVFASILAAGLELKVGANLFVYGDDIILPVDKGADALAILRGVGLTPNPKKTFTSGPFRESCGGDFFLGADVRPVYSTKTYESPLQWIALHNNLRRKWGERLPSLRRIVENVPSRLRCFGPSRCGDSVLHARRYPSQTRDHIKWVWGVEEVPDKIPLDRWGESFTVTLALLGVASTGVVPRGIAKSYRRMRISVS